MKSKLSLNYVIAFAIAFLFSATEKAWAQKEIFLNSKCTKCHSISAQSIEKKKASADDDADDETNGEKIDPPDLSHVGKNHDAAFIKGFITKKIDHVPHEGVKATGKHRFKFKGSDEELEKLANWLAAMK